MSGRPSLLLYDCVGCWVRKSSADPVHVACGVGGRYYIKTDTFSVSLGFMRSSLYTESRRDRVCGYVVFAGQFSRDLSHRANKMRESTCRSRGRVG